MLQYILKELSFIPHLFHGSGQVTLTFIRQATSHAFAPDYAAIKYIRIPPDCHKICFQRSFEW